MKTVRWISALLDSNELNREVRASFWADATGYSLDSEGDFIPSQGDVYLGLRELHMGQHVVVELFVKNVDSLVQAATSLGGRLISQDGETAILASPSGYLWQASKWRGQKRVPEPSNMTHEVFDGLSIEVRVDQIVMQVPSAHFDAEAEYWSALTGWQSIDAAMPNFLMLRDKDMPLRLVVERDPFGDPELPGHINLDIACGGAADLERAMVLQRKLGAVRLERRPWWYRMTDPSGETYCLTRRDARTGAIRHN